MDWVNNWLKNVQILPPRVCALCGAAHCVEGLGLCAGCHGGLPWLGRACPGCALPLPASGQCGACQRRPPPYQRLLAAFHYQPPVSDLIQALKFHGVLSHARLLGEVMADVLAVAVEDRPRLMVPVPLHGRRLRQRGYNQALELARPVARRLGIPLGLHCCRRVVDTAAQSDLSAAARRRNVRNAFRARWQKGLEHVALIDDVMTTGHTVAAAVRSLRAAGAERVEVWVCARALPSSATVGQAGQL